MEHVKMFSDATLSVFWLWLVPTLVAIAALASEPASRVPLKTEVVIVTSEYDSFLLQTGNIRVTFRDGYSETWTQDGFSDSPIASRRGNVGWVRVDKPNANKVTERPGGVDLLFLRLIDGTSRQFTATSGAPFIEAWSFADHDRSVAIRSRAQHGPAFYIKYDIKSGAALATVSTYTPYRKLPTWAKAIADERPGK